MYVYICIYIYTVCRVRTPLRQADGARGSRTRFLGRSTPLEMPWERATLFQGGAYPSPVGGRDAGLSGAAPEKRYSSGSTPICIYTYIYTPICICICICIYTYIYISLLSVQGRYPSPTGGRGAGLSGAAPAPGKRYSSGIARRTRSPTSPARSIAWRHGVEGYIYIICI